MQIDFDEQREKLKELCRTDPFARQAMRVKESLNLSESDFTLLLAVSALQAFEGMRKSYEDAIMVAPPDAMYVRDEDGTRKLIQYIGPTIAELRQQRDQTEKGPAPLKD